MLGITAHYFICEIKSKLKNQCHLSMKKRYTYNKETVSFEYEKRTCNFAWMDTHGGKVKKLAIKNHTHSVLSHG